MYLTVRSSVFCALVSVDKWLLRAVQLGRMSCSPPGPGDVTRSRARTCGSSCSTWAAACWAAPCAGRGRAGGCRRRGAAPLLSYLGPSGSSTWRWHSRFCSVRLYERNDTFKVLFYQYCVQYIFCCAESRIVYVLVGTVKYMLL